MKNWLLLLLLLTVNLTYADEDTHDHHKNHIGIGYGGATFFGEEGIFSSAHIHYLRQVAPESPFAVGIGYEGLFKEHTHNNISLLVNYTILPQLSFNVGPGLTFADEDGESHTSLSGHVELLYEIPLGEFHLGPMMGMGFDGEDSHLSFGIHVGLGF